MNIAIIGLGNVGLTIIGAAAEKGHMVYGYDLDESVIQKNQEMITSDKHFFDGYLLYTIREHMQNIHFSNVYDDNLKMCDVKFLCVDTINVPTAIQMLGPFIKKNDIVIVESTVNVKDCKTITDLVEVSSGLKVKMDFDFAFVPERVMEGHLLQNFERMPRPIGTDNRASFARVKKLYQSLGVQGKLQYTDMKHACASKDFENAFRFVEISIANEFADICRERGLDFEKIRKLVNVKGHGMGFNEILKSGIGIGGPCVPMAANMVAELDWDNSNLLCTAIEMNLGRSKSIAEAILALLKKHLGDLTGKKIAILGATYRPNGIDSRGSPAVEIITRLADVIEPIYVYDPFWPNNGKVVEKIEPSEIEGEFDAIVILVGHSFFKDLSMMKCKFFIDVTGVVKKYPKKAKRKKLHV